MSKVKAVENQGRQGDVFLLRIDSIPKEAKERKIKGDIVIASGTHHHTFPKGSVLVFDEPVNNRIISYIKISKPVSTLGHEEHDAIPYSKGDYVVVNQVESLGGIVSQVID